LFELILTRTFARELKKLEPKDRQRIKKKLLEAGKNPWRFFQRLSGINLFRIRIGKYRVTAQISVPKKQITLVSVKHRKKAYHDL